MAQRPRKNPVKDIIKNLLDSEIPDIQDVAKQLAERIKQLEEHSWKLQHYATEIESLTPDEIEVSSETSLGELLKDLEKTLDELRQRPAGAKEEVEVEVEGKAEAEAEEKAEEVARETREPEKTSEAPSARIEVETYTTPEGFVVRKLRR